jgi:hypothetical protein
MAFTPPVGVALEDHARRLLASPGDRRVPGYPRSLLARADAGVAFGPGLRPVVIVFYDDGSRTSDLQAATFLPVLGRYADRVDLVAIDVTAADAWTPDERRLVRRFYMASVPATVVLDARRRPHLLKYQRIGAAALETALEAVVE